MKFIIILFIAIFLNAENISWQGDYEKALLKAKEESKHILLLIRNRNCNDCQKMFETTLKNEAIISILNQKYICVIATFEDKNSYPIELFYTQTFPTMFFVSRNNELFLDKPIFGFMDTDEFIGRVE